VKPFLLYTAARIGLFALTWVVVTTVAAYWLEWSMVTALWTALIALAVSAVLSLWLLRSLRERLAARVHDRAVRARRSFDAGRAREDEDE
jgi:membrane protein implicated in regulation of membrane protease activity